MRNHEVSNPEDCARVREALSARFDGEAGSDAVPMHLDACPECARFARELPLLSARLEPLRELAPPGDLWARIERSAATRRHAPRPWVARIAALLVGFASVVAAGVGLRDTDAPARPHPLAHPFELLAVQAGPDGARGLLSTPEDHLLRSVMNRTNREGDDR